MFRGAASCILIVAVNETGDETMTRTPASNGNCGGCGAPIAFMNVMLCDECLQARLEGPDLPVAIHRTGDRVESPAFLPFLRTAYS